MRRLWPRSLFGRMVLVLLAGLIIAQLLSALIVFRERERWILQNRLQRSAQRIGDVVRVLEALDPQTRGKVAPLFNTRTFALSGETTGSPPLFGAKQSQNAKDFEAALRQSLGQGRTIATEVAEYTATSPDESDALAADSASMPEADSATKSAPFNRDGLALSARVSLSDGKSFQFRLFYPSDSMRWLNRMLTDLAIRLAAVMTVVLFVVKWVTRPLTSLALAAERLGENINRPPLAETGPAEVKRAAHAFNRMQAQLAAYLRERAQVLAAMSHDLKTPITRLRLRSELLEDGDLKHKYEKDLNEMEYMVTNTLDFMRGVETDEPTQLIDVVALLESLQADFEEMGYAVTITGGSVTPFSGKPQALQRCLRNLIENAVKYGKRATVNLTATEAQLAIRVEDEGPGIPEAELERVFSPFYRLETSRSKETGGTGLGLSIARNIARDHGGEIICRNKKTGGLEVIVTLPVRASRDACRPLTTPLPRVRES